jgi:hypothetical protein
MAQPTWLSSSITFSIELGRRRGEVIRFSAANTTPWEVLIPTAVLPNYKVRKRSS